MSVISTVDGYRISPEQRRAWLIQQSGLAKTGVAATVTIEGALDEERFRQCVASVAAQCEILRTEFRQLSGMSEPLQVIAEDADFQWNAIDARGLSAPEQRAIIESAAATAAEQTRVDLIHTAENRAVVVFAMPALVTDRLGLINVIRAIAFKYLGQPQEEQPAQYADIAQSLNDSLESPEFEAGRSYWTNQWSSKARQEMLALSLRKPRRVRSSMARCGSRE